MHWSYQADIKIWVKKNLPSTHVIDHQIILLHDALGSIPQWKNFPEQLAEQLQAEVILYERQGHGRSSPLPSERSPDFFHQEALEVLPAFIESHQLQEAILLGHSDGATIALLYAAHFNPPGVVAIAPHIFVEDITLRGISKATLVKDKLVNKLRKYHGDKAEKLFNAWADTWLDPQFRSWTIQQELAGISCPLLLIQGAKDEYGSIHQLTGIQEAVPHAQIQLLPGLGHFPQFESPFDILQKIRAFLE
jgi:pimeloyl-ACP methyl ester carboxylesterase